MAKTLRDRVTNGPILIAPGVFDLISLRIADRLGFDALYMSGYGTVASFLGLPDVGLASYSDMLNRVAAMAAAAATPLIADADTGYGGLVNVRHTAQGYEKAGAAALQIEDQSFPKRCGHTPGRHVIPAEEMALKIQVAVETRTNPDFLIIARTDARAMHGLDEALRRGERYLRAGADVLFIEAPESEEEIVRIARAFDAPLVINLVEGGKTPWPSLDELDALGYSIAIRPATGFLAAGAALEKAYRHIRGTSSPPCSEAPELYGFSAFSRLMGIDEIWSFDRAHATDNQP